MKAMMRANNGKENFLWICTTRSEILHHSLCPSTATRSFSISFPTSDWQVMVSAFPEIVTHGRDIAKARQMAQDAIRLVLGSGQVEYDKIHKFEFARRADMLQLRALYPPLNTQAGLKVLAGVRGSRSPGSTKRVLTTSRAIADQKPLLQQRAAQPVEHWPWQQPPSRNRQKTRLSSGLGRRRCERKQTPRNRVRATRGRSWKKTVEDASLPVTQEVASSSLVGPAILFSNLWASPLPAKPPLLHGSWHISSCWLLPRPFVSSVPGVPLGREQLRCLAVWQPGSACGSV